MAIENVISKNGVFKRAPMPESSGSVVVHAVVDGSTATLDKTWQEIFDGDYVSVTSYMGGNKVLFPIIGVNHEETSYDVECDDGDNVITFSADSASGYPSTTIE